MQRFFLMPVFLWCTLCLPAAAPAGNQTLPLSITESITLALDRNPALAGAEHSVRGADFERKAARTDFLPKISTEHSYTRYDETPYAKSPAGEFGPAAMKYKTGTRGRYQWNTSITQPVFAGGALVSSYQIARLGLDIARQNRDMARQDIILQVRQAYFTILKAEKLQAVALQAVTQVQSHVEVAKAFYEEQMVPQNDYLQSQVWLAQTQQDLIRAENSLQVAKAGFNTVLSRHINEPVAVQDVLACTPEAVSLDDFLRQAAAQRPEMKEAELCVEKARSGVSLAQSSYFPSLDLIGNYQKAGEHARMSGSPYEDDEVWTVSTMLRWDVWEWGRKSYKVGAGRAELSRWQEQKRRVADAVALEVKDAYLSVIEAEKNIGVARTAIAHAEENFRINKEQYAEQMATTTDVLDAQTMLTGAQSNYYSALSDYHIARAMLDRAAGRESW